jgi:hypothetical protein
MLGTLAFEQIQLSHCLSNGLPVYSRIQAYQRVAHFGQLRGTFFYVE